MPELQTAYYSSPLGNIKIVASDNAITSLLFTDEHKNVETKDSLSPIIQDCIHQLNEYFNGERKEFSLPLLQSGTIFQQKVWHLLCKIPYGKTTSYLQLSKTYGDPKAIRAIAAANGKNNVAIVVPCHRVIGSNQSLTGYAGGLWRKQWLLNHEAKYFSGVQELF